MQELHRSVLSCLLWEREACEEGEEIAARIERLADAVPVETVAALAVEAREQFHLRHVALLLLLSLVKRGRPGLAGAITNTVQPADEMAELLVLYWCNGRRLLSKQLQHGLADAFGKFDAFALAKYDREGPLRLRHVLFLATWGQTRPSAKPSTSKSQIEPCRRLTLGRLPRRPAPTSARRGRGCSLRES